ncbi:hypothetical protein DSECCO2_399190 [anaerobic digester metagenome]
MVGLKHLADSLDNAGHSDNCNVPVLLVYNRFLEGRDKRDPPVIAASCLANEGFTPGNYHRARLESPGVFSNRNHGVHEAGVESICKDCSDGPSALFSRDIELGFSGSDFQVVP